MRLKHQILAGQIPDSDPVPGVYVVNDRYVHLQGYHFIIKEPLWSLLLNKMPAG